MINAKRVLLLLCVLVLPGCSSSPRVNGTNPDDFLDSLDVVRSELSEEETEEFNYGISAIRSSLEQLGAGIGSSTPEKRFLERIDGMTAAQVIAEGRRIREIRQKKVQEMFPNANLGDES